MSVPLDNLYNWVESMLPEPATLYVFRPPGSKKISDLDWLREYDESYTWRWPGVILHDQEPLDWDFYNCPSNYRNMEWWGTHNLSLESCKLRNEYHANFNLKSVVLGKSSQLYDQVILINSEKNSTDLEKYQQNGFVCVHYWAHAIIARDWYRFAQYDSRLNATQQPKNKFLIYCRDWSHRREYRLKFLELLVQNNLDTISQITVMHINSENVHFSQHQFKNSDFTLTQPELINCIPDNLFPSTASANYEYQDFVNNQISVVLETVFDDQRIHLTEKILRPIACGHPFLLAAGPGSLEYIRSYGFKTFSPWIDESYDQEHTSINRLEKIIASMNKIQSLQGQELEDFSHAMASIAEFNKKHFFSNEFFNCVQNELKDNLCTARMQVSTSRGKHFLEISRLIKQYKSINQMTFRQEKILLLKQLRQSYLSDPSNPAADPVV
jgi:hypothetical protein